MVKNNAGPLDLAFGALSHPIRRGILSKLATGEATVAQLAKPHRVSAPAISRHLRILEKAGLMSRRKKGREHRCKLEAARMKKAQGWLEHHRNLWIERLDAYSKENE